MKNQNKHYQQLTQKPSYQISALRKTGMSLKGIAKQVGIHFISTVNRELRRNVPANCHTPQDAHRLSDSRRRVAAKANKRTDVTDTIICQSLVLGWSPEAISQRLKIEANPLEYMIHSTLYWRVEEDRQQGGILYRQLPSFGKNHWKGGKRNKKAGVKLIPNRVDISERPAAIEDRVHIGNWEGDTVHDQNAHLVTLVDRKS